MLYELLKPLTKKYYSVYYKFGYNTLENVTKNIPLVISPNHTNGFIDPVVIACNADPKVRFFARGDVFKGRLVQKILDDMNISPMYRLQEGYSEIKKNNKSFEECRDLLSRNKSVLLFPEAICVPEKRLQPLKKGLSRIVFQTEEVYNFEKNVVVLPVGIHYSNAQKFRSDLFLNFGKPINLKDYKLLYEDNKVKAINLFTRHLEKEMRHLLIHVDNKHNDELVEGVYEVYLQQWMKEKGREVGNVQKRFESRKEIVEMINRYDKDHHEDLKLMKERIAIYLKKLKKYDLRDHLLHPETIEKSGVGKFFYEFLVLWFGFPFYVIAVMIHGLPLYIAKHFADAKIKKAEFYASMRVNIGMLLWALFIAIQLVIVGVVSGSWFFLAFFLIGATLLGKFALGYYSLRKKIRGRWGLLRLVRKNRNAVEDLITSRAVIIDELNLMSKMSKEV